MSVSRFRHRIYNSSGHPKKTGCERWSHRLNMELDLQSLYGLHVYSCTHLPRPSNSPSTRSWAHIRGHYWSAKIDDISLEASSQYMQAYYRTVLLKRVLTGRMDLWIAFYIIYFHYLTCCVGLQGSALSGFLQVRSAAALSPVSTESCHVLYMLF